MKVQAGIAFGVGFIALLSSGTLALAQGNAGPKVANAKPSEVRVMVTAAIRVPLEEVREQAEKAVGHPLVIEYRARRLKSLACPSPSGYAVTPRIWTSTLR